MSELNRTPLYHQHVQAGALMVDFAGWEMPLHYGSQIDEHHNVRQESGMFDVSHMGLIDITGHDACYFLRHLLANDIQKLTPGKALYTCMLNNEGGVIDDLIAYELKENEYRLVVNAGSRAKVSAWIQQEIERYDAWMVERNDLTLIAIQGPQAIKHVAKVLDPALEKQINQLKPFHFIEHQDLIIARTGYTGEDGVEIMVPAQKVEKLWKALIKSGVKPCGLGARDTLRLEAGLNLYSADMDETTTPLESNLAWTVSWQDAGRDFIGKDALQKQLTQGVKSRLVGLCMQERGVLRSHQKVFFADNGEGVITSGGFSPTLGMAIALARIPVEAGNKATVERRGKEVPVEIVKPPFVKHGQKTF